MRRAARLVLFALVLNILLPVGTVVASRLPVPNPGMSWAAADICSAEKERGQAPGEDHQTHGVVCPFCVLLGSQVLAPSAGSAAVLYQPVAIDDPILPPAISPALVIQSLRPQGARAPPALV